MSLIHETEQDVGPLKLEYDVTPRDPDQFATTLESSLSHADFRYRGYPDGGFERAKYPNIAPTRSQSENIMNPYYGLNHYFDKKQPKVNGESTGLKYGSDQILTSKENNSQRFRSLPEKTSAELRKYHQQETEVQMQIDSFRQEKLDRLMMLEDTKKRDLEQLKNYNPWGKPGGGAPNPINDEHMKQKFTEYDAPPTDRSPVEKSYMEEFGDFHGQFGRPGGGAPIRTDSGHVKPELKADPLIRFQDTKQAQTVMDKDIRYKQDIDKQLDYYTQLENQITARRAEREQLKKQEERQDLETLNHHPFGKPGAGAPNIKSDQETFMSNKQDFDYYDPWGKGHGVPAYDEKGDVKRRSNLQNHGSPNDLPPEKGVSLTFNSPRGGGGAPIKSDSGNMKTRMPITMKKGDYGDTTIREELPNRPIKNWSTDPEQQIYDPWGKPGAGAPLLDSQGQVITALSKQLERKNSFDTKERKQKLYNDLQEGMQYKLRTKEEEERNKYNETSDLATLVRKGQVGRPKYDPQTGDLTDQHLGSTDISKEWAPKMNPDESKKYHTELERAAYVRKRERELEKMRDRQEARHHEYEMSHVWGKPGAGAPNKDSQKLANMEKVLYDPRYEHQQYIKRYLDDDQHNHYGNFTRTTVKSTANNAYEYPIESKHAHKIPYQLVSPYSTDNTKIF